MPYLILMTLSSTELGVSEATDFFPHTVGDSDENNSDEEDNEVPPTVQNFSQALKFISDLKMFAVQQNCPILLQHLLDAQEAASTALMKQSRVQAPLEAYFSKKI